MMVVYKREAPNKQKITLIYFSFYRITLFFPTEKEFLTNCFAGNEQFFKIYK